MFEYDEFLGADNYTLTIIPINPREKKIAVKSTSLAVLVKTGLAFGESYQWHYEAFSKHKSLFKSASLNFSILSSWLIDTSLYKYNITVLNKQKLADNVVFVDYNGVAIDRNGKAIWFLPTDSQKIAQNYRNLAMTKNGTVILMKDSACLEEDMYGNLLWRAPNTGEVSGDKNEHYHHDFFKMNDGTFITSGYRYVNDKNLYDTTLDCKIRYNTLIQYDSNRNVLWTWSDEGHFSKRTFFKDAKASDVEIPGTHLNGFYYDEKNDAFLISFRNISRIIKIDKKTGNVIYQFGELAKGELHMSPSDAIFSKQHSPVLMPDGNILFFNNIPIRKRDEDTVIYPKVTIVHQPLGNKNAAVVWEYECKDDNHPEGVRGKEGGALFLPNGNLLVCVGGSNRTFEVTRDKQVVWNCYFQSFSKQDNKWIPFNNYRSNFSSSLFPQYFTVQQLKNADSSQHTLKINNDGSDDDTYAIEMAVTMAGQIPYTLRDTSTIMITAGSSYLFDVNAAAKKVSNNPRSASEISVSLHPLNAVKYNKAFHFILSDNSKK
jgi:hypothetical protein